MDGAPSRTGGNTISVERVPDGPPLDKADLQTYFSALRSKLYRNASYMHHSKSAGTQTAAVRLSINSDGTTKSLTVLDEADQQTEVAFTLRLLELSAPYAPFPPSMAASIRSLSITFCIRPPQDTGPGAERSGRFGC